MASTKLANTKTRGDLDQVSRHNIPARALQIGYESIHSVSTSTDNLFARFCFLDQADEKKSSHDLNVPLAQFDGNTTCEVWRYPGVSVVEILHDITTIRCDDYLLVAQTLHPMDMHRETNDSYQRILSLIAESEYPHIIKAWNFLPDINQGDGDEECYKQFCQGRAEAFEKAGVGGKQFPAGTAVGCRPDQPLTIFVLTAKHPAHAIENPRQMSAYCYPRQYGVKSPSFSRAVVTDNHPVRQIFLSGTAAIVGHESRHHNDIRLQVDEMIQNVCLIHSRTGVDLQDHQPLLRTPSAYRLYLRDKKMLDAIQPWLNDFLHPEDQIIYLRADICRKELLVEIDGVSTIS